MSLEHNPGRSDARIDSAPEFAEFEDRVLRLKETEHLTGLCDMQLWRMEQDGIFPKRFKINPAGGKHGAAGHWYREVMNFLRARLASRDTAA